MKKISFYLIALAALVGCLKDDRDNFMVPDSFALTARSEIMQASIHTGSCPVGIAKNGKGVSAATATLSDKGEGLTEALAKYNEENGTSFKVLPEGSINLSGTTMSFEPKDVVKMLEISWDPDAIAKVIGDSEDYVIPLKLVSGTEGIKVNEDKSIVFVNLVRSTIAVSQTDQVRSIEPKNVEAGDDGKQPELVEVIPLDLVIDKPVSGVGMTFPVLADASLIAKFNETSEDKYYEAPAGLVTLVNDSVTIPEGEASGVFRVSVDKSKLLKDGKLVEFPNYIVPIRVDDKGIKATRNGSDFTLKGISYGNMVTYILISYASNGISVVKREWGLYSDGAAWYSNLEGFAEGGDIAIAMDNEFVYVANSALSGGIYALNRSNGGFAKKLDLGDAGSDTKCIRNVGCVRMISNPAGDDILSFCSVKGDKDDETQYLSLYAYVNGTDAAPVKLMSYLKDIKPGANDWRRYGYTYTVTGTWQDGQIWFHCWSSGGKTLVFNLKEGEITNPDDPVDYLLDPTDGVIKDVIIYPGLENVLVTQPKGAGIWHNSGQANANQWIQWSKVTDLPDFALTYGYNFFNFHTQDFIAYVKLDEVKGKGGRLVIIDDDSSKPAEFATRLKDQIGLREFPIQHESDFEAESAVASGDSIGDCCVRYINGSTYVAVLVQGCGLSLFQLQ